VARSRRGSAPRRGGKVEARERPAAALRRELQEELALDAEVGEWIGRGDVYEGGRRIVLDVYAARIRGGELTLREHDDFRWVRAGELGGLDWAQADIPVLPALRARLARESPTSGDAAHRACQPVCVLSADWSKGARKRAAFEARPENGDWILSLSPPPSTGWTLAALLERARSMRDETGRGVWIGIDACIGLPAAYVERAGARDFSTAMLALQEGGGLDDGAEAQSAQSWSTAHPFFRVPAGRGGLTRFHQAAGGRSTLLRAIELRTAAKPVFALSGIPGTVGSGSRALWQELAPLLAQPYRDFRIWPFEGSVRHLSEPAEPAKIVVAETYPRASYAVALEAALPARPRALAKTKRAARREALHALGVAPWRRASRVKLRDLEAAEADEDPFDALMAATALVSLLAEGRPLSCPLVDPLAEGGILGTGDVDLTKRPRPPRS